jgi:hypothetical protein
MGLLYQKDEIVALTFLQAQVYGFEKVLLGFGQIFKITKEKRLQPVFFFEQKIKHFFFCLCEEVGAGLKQRTRQEFTILILRAAEPAVLINGHHMRADRKTGLPALFAAGYVFPRPANLFCRYASGRRLKIS